MTNQHDIDSKLNAIASDPTQDWVEKAKQYEADLEWIDRSAKIAGLVLDRLDELGMTQKALADAMGVRPQYVSKIVKGRENLCFSTIAKLEKATGLTLIEVANPKFAEKISRETYFMNNIRYCYIEDNNYSNPNSFTTIHNILGIKSLVSQPINNNVTLVMGRIKEDHILI